jgi:hypothetical protein
MPNTIKILRSGTAGNRPTGHTYGEPYANLADGQFGVVASGGAAQDLIGVPIFSASASYPIGKTVVHSDLLYQALVAVSPGAWNATQWQQVTAGGGGGAAVGANRLINGDGRIDQRNNHALVQAANLSTSYFFADRWAFLQTNANLHQVGSVASASAPGGYYLSAKNTSTTTPSGSQYWIMAQKLEGLDCADLAWGTASASAVTLSFWAQGSVTGTYGGAITNGAQNRSYPFSYTIATANTWAKYTITIPGDTTGTWTIDNTAAITVIFAIGAVSTLKGPANTWAAAQYYSVTGTVDLSAQVANSTLYFAEIKLEIGSTATAFVPSEVALAQEKCGRYYQQSAFFSWSSGGNAFGTQPFATVMRAAPTMTYADYASTPNASKVTTGTSTGPPGPVGGTNNVAFSLGGLTSYIDRLLVSGSIAGGPTNGWVAFTWTASAEL